MTVEEAIKIWQKTKSPYLKRDMEKFIHKHKKGAGNGERTKFAPRRSYAIRFDKLGNAKHTAVLHSVKADSILNVKLEDVEP